MSVNPKYPVYIISKGRWKKRQTSKALEMMGVPYQIVIEPQEYQNYSEYIDKDKILVLPFSNLGQGSIPARNWVWEHSIKEGHERHWILDDNMDSFYRLNRNMKLIVTNGAIFKAAEDFVDRYENIAIAGFQYNSFVFKDAIVPPYRLNTRIYSCILIKNDIDYRWRGKYNEDTDLSLRVLKDGWVTMLFNAFLVNKETTMRASGGNTDELYKKTDNRKEFAESLKEQHPDVVDVVWRFNRWHHDVDYKPFKKNKLIKKENIKIDKIIDNYGMVIKEFNEKMHITKLYERFNSRNDYQDSHD
jgi:hypothetical protein